MKETLCVRERERQRKRDCEREREREKDMKGESNPRITECQQMDLSPLGTLKDSKQVIDQRFDRFLFWKIDGIIFIPEWRRNVSSLPVAVARV